MYAAIVFGIVNWAHTFFLHAVVASVVAILVIVVLVIVIIVLIKRKGKSPVQSKKVS